LHQVFGSTSGTLQANPISARWKSVAADDVKTAADVGVLGTAGGAEQVAL
jgi:hypothetical protein